MFNDELGKSLYVSTVLNSGVLPDFSTIMQLVLGREGKDPCDFRRLRGWVCPSSNVLITLSAEFHPPPLHFPSSRGGARGAWKKHYQKQGLWVTTKTPAPRNTWLVRDLSCVTLSVQSNGRLPWAQSQSVAGDTAPHSLEDPASGQPSRKPPQNPSPIDTDLPSVSMKGFHSWMEKDLASFRLHIQFSVPPYWLAEGFPKVKKSMLGLCYIYAKVVTFKTSGHGFFRPGSSWRPVPAWAHTQHDTACTELKLAWLPEVT